jgi:hypothetical protein
MEKQLPLLSVATEASSRAVISGPQKKKPEFTRGDVNRAGEIFRDISSSQKNVPWAAVVLGKWRAMHKAEEKIVEGMRDNEWEDAVAEGGPEALLDNLIKSGYPWHALAQKLKTIDQQFKIVSDEYGAIHDSLNKVRRGH